MGKESVAMIAKALRAENLQNVSLQYSMMLMAEVLTHLLELHDRDSLQLPLSLLQTRLPLVLTQIINRTLFNQSRAGSWGEPESIETTAYSVLTLVAVLSVPWVSLVRDQIEDAIRKGQRFLTQHQGGEMFHEYLWIEKVTYGSGILRESYRLAALNPQQRSHIWSSQISELVSIPEQLISKSSGLFSALSLFREQPIWHLRASLIEGYTFLPMLKSRGTDILPKQENAKNEYLDLIPCTWVIVNNRKSLFMPAKILWDMMVLTIGNFRVDEYMENVLAKCGLGFLELAKSIISSFCTPVLNDGASTLRTFPEDPIRLTNSGVNCRKAAEVYHSELASFESTIGHYIEEMLDYSSIQDASIFDRKHFFNELQTFLLSHITQIEDNIRFSAQDSMHSSTIDIFNSARTSYFTWVHTTGGDSVSCPMSFAFFTCTLGAFCSRKGNAEKCFISARRRYLASDLCTRLTVMSRMYNDLGSFARDRAEKNVNSVNFPAFHYSCNDGHETASGAIQKTQDWTQPISELLALARYERETADLVGDRFLSDLRSTGLRKDLCKADGIDLLMGVTALYADLYVARDLSNRVDKGL